MKTILFVMPRLPFPTSSGRKTSLFNYCRILGEELNCRLIVAAFLEMGDDPSQKPEFIDRLVVLPKAKMKEKVTNIVMNSFVRKKMPLQVSLFLSQEAREIVNGIIEEEKPDIVIGDMVRSAEYIRNTTAYKIADLDDRLSLRYRRQLEIDLNSINPYGAFLSTMPVLIQKIMLFKPIKKMVMENEISLLNKYEIEIGNECDLTVFVAEKEANDFNCELGKKKAVAVPIGVDIDYFSYRECGNDENIIGFLGAMNVAHNENAVRNFITYIFPNILEKIPDVKFWIIGGGPSNELLSLSSDNVVFWGRVDDVREYLEKCKVFICPMTFGSGIKTKNLEAMSMGLPVVTTNIGAENIDAEDGKDWLISDSIEGFAEAIVDLLSNPDKRRQIGKNSSIFIQKRFTWKAAKCALERIIYGEE